jgi:2,6-dihydroxypyridine 3-monooxygenase
VSSAGPRVVVAGGSIGGLTAALWLRDAGAFVEVFERSTVPLEGHGAGIVLNPATVRWLVEKEGLDVAEVGVGARFVRYLDREGGIAAELPHPYRFSSYDTLYRLLLAAFGSDRYHLGQEVVTADQDDRGVSARLASGVVRECDLLVWADGIRSTGRRQLVPRAEHRYAGYVAWRGTVSPSELSDATVAALREAITYCVMSNSHALTYPIATSAVPLVNWLWYRNVSAGPDLDDLMTDREGLRREFSVTPGAVPDRHVDELREAATATVPPPLAEAMLKTREPFLQAVFDIEVPRMAFGRMCLIGDAAFALRPHAAAGSAKAAEDGHTLGLAMRETSGDIAAALQRWQTGQMRLARKVLARARDAGDRSQFHCTWRVGDPLPIGLSEVGDSIVAVA